MKNDKILFLDMDNTIADLCGYPDWVGILRGHVGDPYHECNPQDPDEVYNMFRNLKPMVSHEYLLGYCRAMAEQIIVFTMTPWGATPEAIKACVDAKNEWLDLYFPSLKNRIMTEYGHIKDANAIMKAYWLDLPDISEHRILPDRGDILIDDSETLRNNWLWGPAIAPPWVK